MNIAKTIHGDVSPGDWVISAGNNDYKYLIGTVIEIVKQGTPEHAAETENDTDNIHVDFTAFDYPAKRITEIEAQFSDLYDEPKTFDELPLDDVIMAPEMLISITNLGHDEITRMGNLRANCESFCSCFPGGNEAHSLKHAMLFERLEKNLKDYHDSLMTFSKRELIEATDRITAVFDAYSYLVMYNRYDDAELDFFLKFQDPLEVVADNWYERRSDLDDMCFTMNYLNDHRDDFLKDYPLVNNDDPHAMQKEKTPEVPKLNSKKSLADKLQAAGEKVMTQNTQNNNKPRNRGERE
jgi:hypothetical protein